MEAILNAPVIVDLGKKKRKSIRQLKQGRGRLVGEVENAMQELTTSLGEKAEGKQIVPVVLLYRRKAKKRKGGGGLFPFLS